MAIYIQLNYIQHKWVLYVQPGNSLYSMEENFDYL